MIDGLMEKYGTDTKFVLCYGMMGRNSTVDADIATVANSYGSNVQYLQFTNTNTNSMTGHPTQANHKASGKELAARINAMLNN